MAKPRTYRLLCPIARALDRIGDRWTLLILRDLHAGPARFNQIAAGLPGLASNLLSTRLEVLQADGLIVQRASSDGSMAYELTSAGERTGPLLFELAAFGAAWPPRGEVRRPGNLRMIAVTLKEALRRAADREDALDLELHVDDEAFGVTVADGSAEVLHGPRPGAPSALRTSYEPLVALGDGRMSADDFAARHIEVVRGDLGSARTLLGLLGRAFAG